MILRKENFPSKFWQIYAITEKDWESAFLSLDKKEFLFDTYSLSDFLTKILFEKRFGSGHGSLSFSKKMYYRVKPFIPHPLQIALRRMHRSKQKRQQILRWPVEDRYVSFQYKLISCLMKNKGLNEIPFITFWPYGRDFAFVITHDVETGEGYKVIPRLIELEKQYGFISIFNIVPERYPIDRDYINSLLSDVFEIGIHGLKHDGKLFFSHKHFSERAKKINSYLKEYGAKGFRSPFTHRDPEMMQELEIVYDMSFFDTDPYEPMPGGTMCIWPFFMGHFIELPYTLAQDSTLYITFNEHDIDIWKKKIDWIEKHKGMVLLNVHPDYIDFNNKWGRKKYPLYLYEELLSYVKNKNNYWHALPKEVAEWWSCRAGCILKKKGEQFVISPHLKGGNIGLIKLEKGNLIFN